METRTAFTIDITTVYASLTINKIFPEDIIIEINDRSEFLYKTSLETDFLLILTGILAL